MKILTNIIITFWLIISIFFSSTYAAEDYVETLWKGEANLNVSDKKDGWDKWASNNHLTNIQWDRHINASNSWEKWISITLVKIARDLKNLFFVIATIYFLIIIIRLLLSENSEEEFWKFKKGILWITVWIIIMQIAYTFVTMSIDKGTDWALAFNLIQNLVDPLIRLLETAASFFFIAIAIFSFYKMVTANGDEEKAKTWKMSIVYAIIGFIVIKVARVIVDATYWKTFCPIEWVTCSDWIKTLEDGTSIIFDIINWLNWFVWIAVVIMIVYIWAQLIFSWGEEEKIKKAKTAMIYIFVWIMILILNYLILTFFLLDNISAVNS